jgi:acyl carrier protein
LNGPNSHLERNDFAEAVASSLEMPAEIFLDDQLRLVEDLGFDSFLMMELGLTLEDLGVELHDQVLPYVKSVGDVWAYYTGQWNFRP